MWTWWYPRTLPSLYINGERADTVDSEYSIGEILGDSSIFYLGKANWGSGEYANCWIDNFRIYDGMLSEDDIAAQYSVFAEQMFWDGVSLPTEPVKGDLDLPETNTAGDTGPGPPAIRTSLPMTERLYPSPLRIQRLL